MEIAKGKYVGHDTPLRSVFTSILVGLGFYRKVSKIQFDWRKFKMFCWNFGMT